MMNYDAHIHLALDSHSWKNARVIHGSTPDDAVIRETLRCYAQAGFTWLRDGGDPWGVGLRAAQLAPDYGIIYRTPGFAMCPRGRYGAFLGRSFSDDKEYLQLLNQARESGAQFVKLMLSGIMDLTRFGVLSEPDLDTAQIKWLIRQAHAAGFAVMAHCNGDRSIRAALEAGVDSLEHGAYMEAETVHMLADSETVWVPTLSPLANLRGSGLADDTVLTQILAHQREGIERAAAMGGKIACGSDAGAFAVSHGRQTERELLADILGEQTTQHLEQSLRMLREKF